MTTKPELIKAIATAGDITQVAAKNVLEFLIVHVQAELLEHGESNIPGLVKFKSVLKPARAGINPRTREPLQIAEHTVIKAKALHPINKV